MVARYMTTPKLLFTMLSPRIDDRGRLWLITNRTRNDSTAIDVFSRSGEFMSLVMVEGRAVGIAFRADRVAVLIACEEDGQLDVIRIYGISGATLASDS